jgi:predicted lipid carrier protein YhbT
MTPLIKNIVGNLPRLAIQLTPKLAQLPVKLTPKTLQEKAAEFAINQLLAEPLADDEMDFLAGKWLEIKVTDLQQSWFFTVLDNKISASAQPQVADVCISGNLNAFALMSAQVADPDTLFFRRDLLIEGSTELGLEIKNLLDTVELDNMPALLRQPLQKYAQLILEQQNLQAA